MSEDHNDDGERPPKRSRKPRSPKYENAPYDVGKYKPPAKHQFQPGNKEAAKRKPRTRKVVGPDELMAELVQIGVDGRGRPIKKPFGEVIDRQLMKKAGNADLKAIKIFNDYRLKLAALKGARKPEKTAAEIREEIEQERKSKEFSATIVTALTFIANAKEKGIIDTTDGWKIAPWVETAMSEYCERHGPQPDPDEDEDDGL